MHAKFMRPWALAVGGLLVGTALAAWALMARSPSRESLPYKLQVPDQGPIAQVVMANGSLQPVATVTVGSTVSGTAAERFVDFNALVTRGQVMLKLDPTQFDARVRQAQGQLNAARQ